MVPSLEEVQAIADAGDFCRIPVRREIMADSLTPIQAIAKLRAASHHCFLLESAEPDERWGRYTFLGFKPSIEITCTNGTMRIRTQVETDHQETTECSIEHPAETLREILAAHKSAVIEGMPPFTGGLVGYFAYDYLKYAEPTLRTSTEPEDFLDMDLMLFENVIAFDSYRQKICIIGGVDANDVASSYEALEAELATIESLLLDGPRAAFEPLRLQEPLEPLLTRDAYAAMVEAAKDHIREGDIFQVVLSNPRRAKVTGSLFDAYRILRCENPSPYMFYFTSDDVEIVGSSPETLVRLEKGELFTYPLAGTRPRGATPEEDAANEAELRKNEKELAEHNMLVDLGRNDLGRISELGSVRVERYQEILRFSKVMHIGSTVQSTIATDKDALDAIDSILPAGTLSGAPKLRACEIIRELEGNNRGIYGGAIGYLDFTGGLDLCIAIRLAYKKNGVVCVQSGAGIVADSDPDAEFDECSNKARAVTQAIEESQGGIA